MVDEVHLIERTDAALKELEDAEVARLNKALERAYKALEGQLVREWENYSAAVQPNLLAQQRSLLLIDQIKELLNLIKPGAIEAEFQKLIDQAGAIGIDLAQQLVEAKSQQQINPIRVPIEVAAIAAKGAVERLVRHSDKFRDEASVIITQGLIQGWGAQRVAGQLRQRLSVAKGAAETIARTEVMTAQNQAAQQFYQQNEIDLVQVIGTQDARICPICAARNGNIYKLGKISVPLHPRDRCYLAPVTEEWLELGLIDLEQAKKFHDDAVAEMKAATGEEPNYGLAPFEKASGLKEAPEPFWDVRSLTKVSASQPTRPGQPSTTGQISKFEGLHTDTIKNGIAAGGKHLQQIDKALTGPDSSKLAALRKEFLRLDAEVDALLDADETAAYQSDQWKRYGELDRQIAKLEQAKEARAVKAMQGLRDEMLASSILGRAEAELLASHVQINQKALDAATESEYRAELIEFFMISDGLGVKTLDKINRTKDRAFADLNGKQINIGKSADKQDWQTTLWHELGHHAEFNNNEFLKAAHLWLNARKSGKLRPLNAIVGGDRYNSDEVGFPDEFINPYVGKFYGVKAGQTLLNGPWTEVMSMGLQYFTDAASMLELYQKDQEHFLLILGSLRDGD